MPLIIEERGRAESTEQFMMALEHALFSIDACMGGGGCCSLKDSHEEERQKKEHNGDCTCCERKHLENTETPRPFTST